jgi:hypothetical protein
MTGVKYDSGKLRYDLIPVGPLQTLAQVYTMGAEKYADDNWRQGLPWKRIYAALQRHLNAFWGGEDFDSESGLPHLGHAAWGCFTLLEYLNTKRSFDDRVKPDAQTRNNLPAFSGKILADFPLSDEELESLHSGGSRFVVLGDDDRLVGRVEIPAPAQASQHPNLGEALSIAMRLAGNKKP